MSDLQLLIERFVASCQQPVLSEPGEELIELGPDNLDIQTRGESVQLQAWDHRRHLVRRVTAVVSQSRSKLELRFERFGKKQGTLCLADQSRPQSQQLPLKSARQEFRELFRRWLRREFPGYQLAELSTEADLEHTLSPAYPRALLRQGSSGLAAIAAPAASGVDGVLSFGLIWLDYLRRREPGASIMGLVLFLPAGQEKNTCLRLRFLDPAVAQYAVFCYGEEGGMQALDLADYGNLDTRLEPCRRALGGDWEMNARLTSIEGVEVLEGNDGSLRYRVHGLEFARWKAGEVTFGLATRRRAKTSKLSEMESIAHHLVGCRSAGAVDRQHPLYQRSPEAWLESQVRANLPEIDASLCPTPVYGQVPAFAAGDRGVLDLLAADRFGRLAVIELKAAQDIHLPLRALDYWMRVKWHLDRREFSPNAYFPGIELSPQPPRILFVAPALEHHPSNECVLRFFSPRVPVERMGVGTEWRKQLKIMYRI